MTTRQLTLLLHSLRSIQKECEEGKNYWHEAWQYEFHQSRKIELERFIDDYLKNINIIDFINPDYIINLN